MDVEVVVVVVQMTLGASSAIVPLSLLNASSSIFFFFTFLCYVFTYNEFTKGNYVVNVINKAPGARIG